MNAVSLISSARRVRRLAAVFVAMAGLGLAAPAPAVMFDIHLDTTALQTVDAVLVFDFIDGDSAVNNTVTLSNFATDGTPGPDFAFGDVTGSLPGPVVLGDAVFFNSLTQDIVLGTFVSLSVTLTENFAAGGPFPDSFAIYLYDPFILPLYPTDDPLGFDALMTVDLTGPGTVSAVVYEPLGQPAAFLTVASVTEPGSLLLLGLGLALVVAGGVAGARRRGTTVRA